MDCPICGDPFTDKLIPLQLPCLHLVCSICLPDLNLQCRECRENFQLDQVREDSLIRVPLNCSLHSKPRTMFCKTCNRDICEECVCPKDHERQTWEEFASPHQNCVEETEKKVEKFLATLDDAEYDVRSRKETLSQHREAAVQSMTDLVQDEIKAVSTYLEQLLDWRDSTSATILETFETYNKEVELYDQNIQTFKERGQRVRETLTRLKTISSISRVEAHLWESVSAKLPIVPYLESEPPQFFSGDKLLNQYTFRPDSLGTLKTGLDNPRVLFGEGPFSKYNHPLKGPSKIIQLSNGNLVIYERKIGQFTILTLHGRLLSRICKDRFIGVKWLAPNSDGGFFVGSGCEITKDFIITIVDNPRELISPNGKVKLTFQNVLEVTNLETGIVQALPLDRPHDVCLTNDHVYFISGVTGFLIKRELPPKETTWRMYVADLNKILTCSIIENTLLYLFIDGHDLYLEKLNLETFEPSRTRIRNWIPGSTTFSQSLLGLTDGSVLFADSQNDVVYKIN
jgi:hypothetical protein